MLHPKWFFSYRSLVPGNKFFKNYGYPVAGAMKGKLGIVSISYGGPMMSYWNFSFFDNIPFRRIKKSVFLLGGLRTKYIRFVEIFFVGRLWVPRWTKSDPQSDQKIDLKRISAMNG